MPEFKKDEADLLSHIARGTVLSLPVLGAYLEQVIFGTLDDQAARAQADEFRRLFASIAEQQQKSDTTVGEVLAAVRKQSGRGDEISAKLDQILAAIGRPEVSGHGAKPTARTPVPTVFVSSTIDDLGPYREKAKAAANRAEFLPVLSQDLAASQHKRPLDLCRERAAQADVLVVIVGHRYGWVPPGAENDEEKSITWLECEAARAEGKEILAFLVDPTFKGLDAWREKERFSQALDEGKDIAKLAIEVPRNIRKLGEFRAWLSSDEHKFYRKTFTNPDNLALEVYQALEHWRARHSAFSRMGPAETRTEGDPARYLQLLRESTEYLDIRGLKVGSGTAQRYPIEDLYIPLTTFRAPDRDQGSTARPGGRPPKGTAASKRAEGEIALADRKPVELHGALQSRRLVIVGDPGSGKTTFLQRVAFALCQTLLGDDPTAAEKRLGLKDSPLPILIRIGEFTQHIRNRKEQSGGPKRPTTDESPDWLLDYLQTKSVEFNWRLDRAFLRRKMAAGEAIVLLDGLDEAPGQDARKLISKLCENAVQAYQKSRFVVTTRPQAYTDRVRLPRFDQVDIAPLDLETVKDSLQRWSAALYPESREAAERHCTELLGALRERPPIRRMVTTPVMLTALAVVHWNERRLPEQRADLYESIIAWLAEQREKRPGRLKSEKCLEYLQDMALAMQRHPDGRQESVPQDWAASQIKARFAGESEEAKLRAAECFLDDEEIDSGIIISRKPNLTFWHPTFREFLAARAIRAKPDEEQYDILFHEQSLYKPEWREVLLLLSGLLAEKGGRPRVDALVTGILGALDSHADLRAKARCVGLLGAIVRDLSPLDYEPSDPAYRQTLNAVMDIFDAEKSQTVPFKDRLDAADALGQAGDPRLEQDNWVTIPAGSFRMGSDTGALDEKPVHEVYVKAFQIGRYPTTVREFSKFIDDGGYDDPRWWKHPQTPRGLTEPGGWEEQLERPNHPVTRVTWFEAAAYCKWLSDRLGARIRLPTEAEWERAACGGKVRKYPWGGTIDPSRANYDYEGSPRGTTPVGLYSRGASAEGIDDMAGNVWEWVNDWYAAHYYRNSPEKNPPGPPKGKKRVIRGGSWNLNPRYLRCSFRFRVEPVYRYYGFGFRCVREVSP